MNFGSTEPSSAKTCRTPKAIRRVWGSSGKPQDATNVSSDCAVRPFVNSATRVVQCWNSRSDITYCRSVAETAPCRLSNHNILSAGSVHCIGGLEVDEVAIVSGIVCFRRAHGHPMVQFVPAAL